MIQQTHTSAWWCGVYHKKILTPYVQHHLDDPTYYHTPIFTQPHYFLLRTRVDGEHTKRSACHHFDSCVSNRMAWLFLSCRQGHRITGKGLKTWNRATSRRPNILPLHQCLRNPTTLYSARSLITLIERDMATMVPIHAFTFERHDFFYLVWASNHQEIREDHKNSILRTKHVTRTSMFTANHDLSLSTLRRDTYSKRYDNHIFHSCDSLQMIWHLVSGRSIETPLEVLKDFPDSSVVPRAAQRSQSMMNIHTYITFNHRRSKKNEGRLYY